MNRNVSITIYDVTNRKFTFSNLVTFYELARQESDFWEKQLQRIQNVNQPQKHTFLNFHTNFKSVANIIDSWTDNLKAWDEASLQQNINQTLLQTHLRQSRSNWLWSGNPAVENFVLCHLKHGINGATAFAQLALSNQINSNFNNKDVFFGTLAAYEFLNQESLILKRRNGEKVSLGHLRTQLADAKEKLFKEVEEFKDDYSDWYSSTVNKEAKLYRITKRLGERGAKQKERRFQEQLREWSHTINELEKTYEEKLRLQKPAEYWHMAARKYGVQGGLWSLAMVALVVVGLIYFREFFITWLQGQEIKVKLNNIEGVILFASIAAIYAFLMRALSRLAFSSFHLMRDAEEREQLTYLYLSLSRENADIQESRELILQSLFSRSETGLLGGDHGPTMPTASEVLKTASSIGKR